MSNNQRERSGSHGNSENLKTNGGNSSPQRGFGRGSGGPSPNRTNPSPSSQGSYNSATPGRGGGKQTTTYRVKDKNANQTKENSPLKSEAKPFTKQEPNQKETKIEEVNKPPTIKIGPPPSSSHSPNRVDPNSSDSKPNNPPIVTNESDKGHSLPTGTQGMKQVNQGINAHGGVMGINMGMVPLNPSLVIPPSARSSAPFVPVNPILIPIVDPSSSSLLLPSGPPSNNPPSSNSTAPSSSVSSYLPPRTHSAPPNEREQTTGHHGHIPYHTVNHSFGFPPFTPPQFFNPSFYPPPPFIPHHPIPPLASSPSQPQSRPPTLPTPERKKNIIPIVNPNTNQVVDISSSISKPSPSSPSAAPSTSSSSESSSTLKENQTPITIIPSSSSSVGTANATNGGKQNSASGVAGYGGPPPSTFASTASSDVSVSTNKTSGGNAVTGNANNATPDMLMEFKTLDKSTKKEISSESKQDQESLSSSKTEEKQKEEEEKKEERDDEGKEKTESETENDEDSWENNAGLIEGSEGSEEEDRNSEGEETSVMIQYPEGDYWRPNHTSGKKQYKYEFMMQFKELCQQKPEGLPTNLIMDNTTSNPQGNLMRSGSFGYGKGGRNNLTHSRDRSNLRSSNSSMNGGKGRDRLKSSSGKSKKNSSSGIHLRPEGPQELVGLSTTTNKWIAQRYQPDDAETQILRVAQGILNKMSEENFESLSQKLLEVGIENANLLEEILRRIFEKALIEVKFRSMYANLCQMLSVKCPSFGTDTTFKRLLLGMCQTVFEASLSEAKTERDKEKASNAKELSKEEKEEMMAMEMMAKKRVVGNINFIGELYKRQMLNDKIMHRCIQELMGDASDPQPEDVESLCVMLTSIGSQLDQGPHRQKVEVSFMYLIDVLKNKKVPSRILFMIQDLLQLRKNNWISRSEAKTQQQQQQANKLNTSSGNVTTILQRSNSKKDENQGGKGRSAITNSSSGINTNFLRNSSSNSNNSNLRNSQTQISGKAALNKSTSGRSEEKGKGNVNKSASSGGLKLDAIVQEFLNKRGDPYSLISKSDPKQHSEIAAKLLLVAMDKETTQHSYCKQLSDLFNDLFKNNIFSKESLARGFEIAVEKTERSPPDGHKWVIEDLGLLIADGILDRYLTLPFLQSCLSPLSQSKEIPALDVAAVVFRRLSSNIGDSELRQMIEKDQFKLSPLFSNDEKAKLDFLDQFKGLFDGASLEDSNQDKENVTKQLVSLIEKGETNPVLNFIDESMDDNMLTDPTISRSATNAFFKMINKKSNGSTSQEADNITRFAPILKPFLSSPVLQSGCVLEIQQFCSSLNFPEGMMERILDVSYEAGLIAKKGLLEWKSNAPSTPEKKIALSQLSDFLSTME